MKSAPSHMKFAPLHTSSRTRAATAFALVFVASLCAEAQTASHATNEHAIPELSVLQPTDASPAATQPASETPTASPTPATTKTTRKSPSLEHEFVRNVLRDQRAIWTSPFRLSRGDARWLAPLGLSVAALIATDRHTAGAIDNDDHLSFSRHFSDAGSIYGAGGAAVLFYLVGRSSHDARARETGVLGGEAVVDGLVVSNALKFATRRTRPLEDSGEGEFFSGGSSFPSGHAITAWSFATVVAEEYHGRGVRLAAYGLASAVSLARYTGRKHFLSDVFVGSALGYGVGRYVYHTHHDPSLDADGAEVKERSRLLPRVAPEYNRGEREYGVRLAWSF